jgi:hypothetical protein
MTGYLQTSYSKLPQPKFKVGDKVVCIEAFGTRGLRHGSTYVVNESQDGLYAPYVRVTNIDNPYRQAVLGDTFWQSRFKLADDGHKFKVGDKVKLLNPEGYPFFNKPGMAECVMTVVGYEESRWIAPSIGLKVFNPVFGREQNWGDGDGSTGDDAFRLATEEEVAAANAPAAQTEVAESTIDMTRNTPMTLEEARELRKRIIQETGTKAERVRLRNRSWDTQGIFFAIEVYQQDDRKDKPRRLYFPHSVAAFLIENVIHDLPAASQAVATDDKKTYYYFRHPKSTYAFIPSSSYVTGWTEEDIKASGGIALVGGKRYRLGQMQFVPFVPVEEPQTAVRD